MTVRRRAVWFDDERWARLQRDAMDVGASVSAYLVRLHDIGGFEPVIGEAPSRGAQVARRRLAGTEVATEVHPYDEPGRVRITCDLCDWGTLAIPAIAEAELAEHLSATHPVIDGPAKVGLPTPPVVRRRQPVDPTKETPTSVQAPQHTALPHLDVPSDGFGHPSAAPKPEKKDKGKR